MRFKKGSKEAKAFMAKLRAAKGKPNKVGASFGKNPYTFDVDAIRSNGQIVKQTRSIYADNIKQAKSNLKKFLEEKLNYKNILITAGREGHEGITKIEKIGSKLKLTPKETRLGATEKDFKPKSKSYHKDTKSHNVKISVVSGIGGIDYAKKLINEVQDLETNSKILKDLKDLQKVIKNKSQKEQLKKTISYYTAIVKSNKNNISIIKRYIK